MKKLILVALFLIAAKYSYAYDQVRFPNTMANGVMAPTQTTWNSPDNAKIEDGVVTSTRCPGLGTVLLEATNFGFNISPNAIITGIKVRVKENENTDVIDRSVVLFDLNSSSAGVTDHATGNSWPTPLAFVTYGSATDLWGRIWTPADINSSNFGIGIAADRNAGGSQDAEIDVIEVTVSFNQETIIYSGTIYNGTLR